MAMSFKPAPAALLCAIVVLGGCDTIHPNGSLDPGFGEVARYNAAQQVIDPDPQVGPNAAAPGGNGATAAAAAKRYRTDNVKPVERVQTTQGGSGSSSNQR